MNSITITGQTTRVYFGENFVFGVIFQHILTFFKNHELTKLKRVSKSFLLHVERKIKKSAIHAFSTRLLLDLVFDYETENFFFLVKNIKALGEHFFGEKMSYIISQTIT